MEDHLRNKNRLMKEWEALCSYQAEPSAVSVAQSDANGKKNRCADSVPCELKVSHKTATRLRVGIGGAKKQKLGDPNQHIVLQMTTPGCG